MGSLMAHLEKDPPTAIVSREREPIIDIKPGLLAVMPKFYGLKNEDPYNFLHEFIKICRIQKRLAGVTEEQFRLAAIPFAFSGEANVWFLNLRPISIKTWVDMKKVFLNYFFPATKTNAITKEITGAHQDFDETLSAYWTRFKRMVDSCSNNKMSEGEIILSFYEGMTVENKNLVNSSSGGDFSYLRVSETRKLMHKLVDATRAYEEPCSRMLE